jgi:hypothetical protein
LKNKQDGALGKDKTMDKVHRTNVPSSQILDLKLKRKKKLDFTGAVKTKICNRD